MAEEMTGMGMLNKLVEADAHKGCSCFVRVLGACCNDFESCGECNERVRKHIAVISEKIERERAEELAAARRERDGALESAMLVERREGFLADEAREAVERLRMVSHDDILRSVNPEHEIVDELCKAVGVVRQPTYTGTFDAISDRLIELIEHGGKRDADLCDVCKRTVSLEWVNERGGLDVVQERINSFARMLNSVDSIVCGDEQHCFGERVDLGEADELFGAIYGELDKRLMPPGMAWPRWDDGKQVSHYDTLEDATAICLALDGSCYSLHYDMPDGERVCLFDGSERVKRPEPEVLGADGKLIKVGETVYDRLGGTFYVFEITHGGIETTCGYLSASEVTHTPPDTQERIDDDASMPPRRYYAAKIGHDVGLKDDEEVFTAVALDLLRRQRELDAKTMGGAK